MCTISRIQDVTDSEKTNKYPLIKLHPNFICKFSETFQQSTNKLTALALTGMFCCFKNKVIVQK